MFTILFLKRTSDPIWELGPQVSCKSAASRGEPWMRMPCLASRRVARTMRRPLVQWVGRRELPWSHRRARLSVQAASCIPTPCHASALVQDQEERDRRPGRFDLALRRILTALCFLSLIVLGGGPVLADPRIDRSVEAAGKDLVTPEAQQAIDSGLAFLAARQDTRDGSFGSMASSRRRVAVTALAGMAFLSSGNTPGRGKYGTQVQKIVDFLLSRFQPNGFIFDEGNTGHGPMYDHGFATLFLAEVYGMSRDSPPAE